MAGHMRRHLKLRNVISLKKPLLLAPQIQLWCWHCAPYKCSYYYSPHFTHRICKYDLHFIHILALTSASQGHTQVTMGSCPLMAVRWSTINNIIVSGKAILSGEDSRKPFGGRGSAKPYWGSWQRSPRVTGHWSLVLKITLTLPSHERYVQIRYRKYFLHLL